MHRISFWFDLAGLLLLVLLWVTAFVFIPGLPERIAVHFDASGRPDGFGQSAIAWSLPVVSSVLFVMLAVVGRNPGWLNYPVKITLENSGYQYALAANLLRLLNAILQGIFLGLLWITIESSHGNAPVWAPWLLWLSVSGVLLPLFIYIWMAVGNRSDSDTEQTPVQ